MTAFRVDEWGRDDLGLFQSGPVHLYWQMPVLEAAIDRLVALGYSMKRMDASAWRSEADMHAQFSAEFEFPSYYGMNLDALNDCLGDVALFGYGASPEAAGTVLVLTAFDRFNTLFPRAAHHVLDIWTSTSRFGMLFGHRMLFLVQSDDPTLEFPPLGMTSAQWNPAEASFKARGISP